MKKFTLMVVALFSFGVMNAQTASKVAAYGSRTAHATTTTVQRNVSPVNPAAVIFSDNMDGDNTVIGLTARGYATYYRGTGLPGVSPTWFQGNPLNFISYNGADSSYVSANYNSVTGSNKIDNWLVLPSLSVGAGDSLSFWSQAPLASSYPDSLRIMYNATGATLPEDANWVELGRMVVNTNGQWERAAYEIPAASATGSIAIRYNVVQGGPSGLNSDLIGIDQIDVFSNVVANFDDCAGATDINSIFGGAVGTVNSIGPYDNTTATTDASDPVVGWECFGEPDGTGTAPELNNTVWFTFTGDGSNYFVESGNCAGVTNYISDGDTQFALYTGSCGSLTPVKCNEDGPSATAITYPAGFSFSTVAGTQYYLMVDGFSFQGAVATGQFCLKATKQTTVVCADPSITVGTVAANVTDLCFGDTLIVSATGAVTPNVGDYFGISWIISSADISASTDPLNDPALIATYTFTSPAPAISTRSFINDGTVAFLAPGATYFWTPIVFGNAAAAAVPQFLTDLTLDNACIVLGPSLQVNVLVDGDPLCSGVGINETAANAYGISSIFPVPAKDNVNFTINAKENSAVTISIKNNLGQEIVSRQVAVNKGKNALSFDLKGNAAGFYFINVSGDKGNYNVKFVKQ